MDQLTKALAVLLAAMTLSGCSSMGKLDTSQRLTAVFPQKDNTEQVRIGWTQYVYDQQPNFRMFADDNQKIEIIGDNDFCGTKKSLPTMPDEQVNAIVTVEWLDFNSTNDISISLMTYKDSYKPAPYKLPGEDQRKTDYSGVPAKVLALPVSLPIEIIMGTVGTTSKLFRGELFAEPQKSGYLAKDYFYNGDTVYYATAKATVTTRKDKLLYPVKTPTNAGDWDSSDKSYIVLFAVKESNEERAKQAICGIF